MSPDTAGPGTRLVLCSKSSWAPAMRREHAFAKQAAAHGLGVDFIESPTDVRGLRDGLRAWSGGLGGRRRAGTPDTAPSPAADSHGSAAGAGDIAVWRRSAPLPGHRGPAARRADCALLGRVLRTVAAPDSTVVAMLPWQWGALAGAPARRRVFDCADNWAALIPQRAVDITEQFTRIAAEADEILVTSPLLAPLFPGRDVRVVRNGADAGGSAGAPTPLPGRRRLAYVGTLSERFDAALLAGALDRLPPGWRVDLYGPCLYAGLGDRPGADLRALLDRPGAPVRWHGPLARADLAAALDTADVLVLPNRTAVAHGQSSMKMYDYAARGRPVVTTALEGDAPEQNPDVHVGSTPAAFAAAVLGATAQLPETARAQVAWARGNTWAQRWPAWAAAVLGARPGPPGAGPGGVGDTVRDSSREPAVKVSVLSSDLSHNCLGRAWVVANLLADRHEVEIVGPVLGADVWEPLRHDTSVAYRPLDRRLPLRRAVAAADGDVLYAVKPKGTSLGRALLARRARRRALIADVDDWEMAFFLDDRAWMARNMVRLWDPTNVWATWAMERAVASADAVTVSSRWLQQRFGGVVVPHARDGAVLDPAAVDGRAVRDEYGLRGRKVVLFLGSPRPHKGIGTVLEALDRLADPQVVFLVVGVDVALPARDYLVAVAPQPFDRIPAFLAAADVVVLAQHATRAARAQVPAKVFDAMAMGTPVIATAVSDLPDILRRGGVVVPPGDAGELAGALDRLLGDPARTRALGAAGREDFLSRFSFDALRPVLHGVLDSAVLAAGR